jgi:CBS domain containing-hemolysin-like protein
MDFCKILNLDIKDFEKFKGEAETIGGLIVEKTGRIPMNNESIIIDKIKFIVEASDVKRIKMVKIIIQH